MRAAQYDPATGKVSINEVKKPEIGDDELLVKIVAASLCHSDLMCIAGQIPRNSQDPITIGHEAAGEVVEVGSNVRRIQKGDQVGFLNAYHACWSCKGCSGHFMLCSDSRMRMQGFTADGFFQEYCAIDAASAVVLPDGMKTQDTAPIFCAGITSYQAVLATELQPGQTFAVVGCGGLGQLAIRYAKASGYKVLGIDIDDETLEMAKTSGADHVFNSRSNKGFASEVTKLTNGGCDAVAVFSAAKPAYESAPDIIATGGIIVCVGLPAAKCEFSILDISLQRYRLRGAGNSASAETLRECAAFTEKHNVVSPQKYFALDQIGDMITTLKEGRTGGQRQVVRF